MRNMDKNDHGLDSETKWAGRVSGVGKSSYEGWVSNDKGDPMGRNWFSTDGDGDYDDRPNRRNMIRTS